MARIIRFVSILIASALLLSAAKAGSDPSRNPRRDQSKKATAEHREPAQQEQKQVVPLSALQTEQTVLLEAVRAIQKQTEAQRQQAQANQKSYSSPSVRIQIGLLVVGAIYSFFAGWQLVVIRRHSNILKAATMAATKSAEAAHLALNAERPYVFLEMPDIKMSLRLTLPEGIGGPLVQDTQATNVGLSFNLRNRGKGVAILGNVKTKMLIGGLIASRQAETGGRADAGVRVRVIGGGEMTECWSNSWTLPIDSLTKITEYRWGLTILVLVRYSDVFKRTFTAVFPLDYNAPLIGPDGKALRPALLVQRRQKRPHYT